MAYTAIPAASGGGGVSTATLPLAVTGADVAINAATTTTAGSLSANDKTLVDFGAAQPDTVEAQFLFSKNASLNYFPPLLYMPYYGPGTSLANMLANNALIEGGGTGNNATAYATGPNAETWQAVTSSIFQAQKTSAWGLTIFGKLPTPVTAKNTMFGIRNAGATHTAGFRVEFDINAAAQTKFLAFIEGTAVDTGIVADGASHRFTMVVIGANIAFFIDGAAAGTIAQGTFTADEPMYLGCAGTTVHEAKLQYAKIGCIRPT